MSRRLSGGTAVSYTHLDVYKRQVQSFVFDTCKAEANWNMTNFVNDQIELIRRQVGDKKVLLALSGGDVYKRQATGTWKRQKTTHVCPKNGGYHLRSVQYAHLNLYICLLYTSRCV